MGPSQRDEREAAPAAAGAATPAAGFAAVAPGLAGITGLAAGPEKLLLVDGGVLAAGGVMLRCMPKLRPPPIRAASAKSEWTMASEANAARATMSRRFT
jgi:hypothetical protein